MMARASVSVWAGCSGCGDTWVDLAIDLDGRRKLRGDEQVAAVAAHHQLEQVVDEFTGLIAFHPKSSLASLSPAGAGVICTSDVPLLLVFAQAGADHAQAQRQFTCQQGHQAGRQLRVLATSSRPWLQR